MTNLELAIEDAISEWLVQSANRLTKIEVQDLRAAILDALGDTLGATQEKLMTQLTAARTELQTERNRSQALYHEVENLRDQLRSIQREGE